MSQVCIAIGTGFAHMPELTCDPLNAAQDTERVVVPTPQPRELLQAVHGVVRQENTTFGHEKRLQDFAVSG